MSYQWQDASTPQGRERLKKLMEGNVAVISMSGDGELSECFIEPDGTIVINHSSYEDWQDVDEMDVLFGLEFLDPLADDRTLVARLVDDIFDSKYCPRENLGSVAADMVKAAIKRLAGMEANQ